MYIYVGVGTEIFINNNEQKQMTQKILFLFRLVRRPFSMERNGMNPSLCSVYKIY